ncbi:hypothetical protein V6Z11_A03G207000 [Gossypium hirsutum]
MVFAENKSHSRLCRRNKAYYQIEPALPKNGSRRCLMTFKPRPLFFFFLSFSFSPHSCSPQQNPSFIPEATKILT